MPSVHAVQVLHVHVVKKPIETPQLQILEESVEFPATRSDVTSTAPVPVIEHVPDDTYAAPAHLAPPPVTEYIAQAHVVQRDDGKCSSLEWTRNHFLLHHHPAMSRVVETRFILPEDFLVLLLSHGCPRSKWMVSDADLLQKF